MTNIDISPEAVERLIAGFEEFCLNEGIRLECVSQERAALRALSAALTQSRAETAAAYKRAVETAEDHVAMRINQIETEKSKAAINIDVPQVMRWGAGKVQAEVIRDAIRTLATPDQTAALNMLIAEAEALAVEKTAAMVRTWRNTTPMTGEECANAILALIGEKK